MPATPPFSPDSSVVERVEPSPNFDERTGLALPDMIILHYTGMQFAHEAELLGFERLSRRRRSAPAAGCPLVALGQGSLA